MNASSNKLRTLVSTIGLSVAVATSVLVPAGYIFMAHSEVEARLSRAPGNHPALLKFLDRVNYYGQAGELDAQGRVLIPSPLRDSASIVGDVRVFGRISYLDVWNEVRFAQKLQREPWTDEDGEKLSEFGM